MSSKTTKTTKVAAKTEESEFFKVGDRIQWFRPDGPRIGVIDKLFKDKCWIRLAGAENVGEEIAKGVPLLEIEAYSSEPGPIETALAELQGPQFQKGDRVRFLDDPDENGHQKQLFGVVERTETHGKYLIMSNGELWHLAPEEISAAPGEEEQPEGDRSVVLDDNEEELDLDQSANAGTLINADEAAAESESDDFGLFWLPIDAIAEHPAFQPRGNAWQRDSKGINNDVVAQYAEWLEYSEPPAIEVWHGQIDGQESWWVLSGHHRIRALIQANRDKVQCFQKAASYEDAVYRAAISNAGGGDRTRQIYKMSQDEWAEACKQFLRVCDRLSEEAINEFMEEAKAAAKAAGVAKPSNKLNDVAIGRVFGIPRSTVGLYRKHIELEKEAAEFPKGTRVLLTNYTELQLLGDRKYRLGVVNSFDANNGLHIIFDYTRCRSGYHLPKDLVKVDDPLYEKPTKFKVGDRLWHEENGFGIVVSIESVPLVKCLKGVSDENPLIMWESGQHSANGLYKIDYEGHTKSIPSVDERLSRLIEYIAVDLKDEPENSYLKINAIELHRYLSGLPMDDAPTSTKQEEKSQRQELLGRSLPASGGGMNGSELPDKSATNGKHPEDPEHTAIGPLERPTEAGNLKQAQLEARKSAALTRYNDLLFDLEVMPDDALGQLIKAAKSELTRRHRPKQEGDPQKQQEYLEAC